MTSLADPAGGIVRVAAFNGFFQRFEDLIGASSKMTLHFIHSRRWRENHDSAIKAFAGRDRTTLEVFLPDLENHELMFSLEKHFDDGPQIPSLVVDAYRYFARLARDHGKPARVWLFQRYPTYSFYQFDDRAIVALYSNTTSKKGDLPAFEITLDSFVGKFLASDARDLKKECRSQTPPELETVIREAG